MFYWSCSLHHVKWVLYFQYLSLCLTSVVSTYNLRTLGCFMSMIVTNHCSVATFADVKSMVSAGLATLSCVNFDLSAAICGKEPMNVLCIGHGGGSIPLFLASKIQGAVVHSVEIDPIVISASTKAMGFPQYAVMTKSGERACLSPDPASEVLWKGIHERIQLHESDAEKFMSECNTLYDIVFIDAYDGEDIFPNKLWDPDSPFLRALGNKLHPVHGTVVVNLHSDVDLSDNNSSGSPVFHVLPMGKYVYNVCRAYKDMLLGHTSSRGGLAYTVSAPWVCNTSFVVCRGFGKSKDREFVLNSLLSKSLEVESMVGLPFTCLEYLKRGFTIVS
ncbi:OLC1v1019539C1 [Oldenlandia corymbosa var. corymbosa]|uniref:OLC1v1019539C1 n=1 Tax=Oldenlandia corymbosa var. corymbosa TaxID=529605 RepID=A0AAV1EEN6_OLDCO|nr:OLC1v1019539C1 [Oldenlandia corymbosa var. corymbosa]